MSATWSGTSYWVFTSTWGPGSRCEAITAKHTRCTRTAFWCCSQGSKKHVGRVTCARHLFPRRGYW